MTSSNYSSTGSTTKPTYKDFTNGAKTIYWYVHTTNGNYNDISGSNTVNITKKGLAISAHSVTYNGGKSFARNNYATGVGSEKVNLTYAPYAATVGTYTYATSAAANKFTLTLSNTTNYSISSAGNLTIGKLS